MPLAGSSPTRIVASPGRRPVRATNASTSRATSSRTRAATALPSMIVATARTLALGDRRVLGHELALGAVGREPHHDDAAGLGRRHDPFPEGGVDDVVAHPERGRAGR